jgi:hypothetical protein
MDGHQARFEFLVGDVTTAFADDMAIPQADKDQVLGHATRQAIAARLKFAPLDIQRLPSQRPAGCTYAFRSHICRIHGIGGTLSAICIH